LTSATGGIGAIPPEIDSSGQKIVFASDRDMISGGNSDGNFEIFTIQVNGTGLTQLTHTTGAIPFAEAAARRQRRSAVQPWRTENHLRV
jgi:Tol biopolymer transport system component